MKRKSLKNRMLLRIKKSNKTAFISSDFFDLSDKDQVGRVLRFLVKEQILIKLGRGIFAKTKQSLLGDKKILAKEVFFCISLKLKRFLPLLASFTFL